MLLPSPERCCYPGCSALAHHQHHVTYIPEVIKPLCRPHHEEITILNGQQARKYRRGLSNRHRWWIWFQWFAGKLKGRRTRKALEYISEWDRTPAVRVTLPITHESSANGDSATQGRSTRSKKKKGKRNKKVAPRSTDGKRKRSKKAKAAKAGK